MNRRDTIIVAVLINAGLLAVLFMIAINPSEELGTPPRTELVRQFSDRLPVDDPVAFMEIQPNDEIDQALKNLAMADMPPQAIIIDEEFANPPERVSSKPAKSDDHWLEVTVKKGDSLDKIAKIHHVTIESIKRINGLRSDVLRIGQVLRIPEMSATAARVPPRNREHPPVAEVTPPSPTVTPEPLTTSSETVYYTLKSGDNPWKIAKQFKVRFDELLRLNQLDEEKARNLKPRGSNSGEMTVHARLWTILALLAIFGMGLLMIFSTTSAEVLDHDLNRSTHQAIFKQMAFALVGIALGYWLWREGYEKFLAFSPFLLVLFTFFLVIVLIPGIGKEVNGSKRWISLFGLSFQPSEFVKFILPAFLIDRLAAMSFKPHLKQFLFLVGGISIPITLILVEPNNGTAAVIALATALLFFLSGISWKYWAAPLLALAVVGGLFASQLPYVTARVNSYMHPEKDIKGKGHQPHQAKIAAGSGGLLGRGPGQSLQKLSYLPEAQNDYIAAIFAEEYGFAGIFFLITCYAGICLAGFTAALNAPTMSGSLLAAVITFLFGFQAFLNLGVVSGLLPSTGLNLPLFSQGGSSLMANIAGLGLLFSTGARQQDLAK